jgi:hypothetical protein
MDSALREAADQLGLGASFPGLDRINTLQARFVMCAVVAAAIFAPSSAVRLATDHLPPPACRVPSSMLLCKHCCDPDCWRVPTAPFQPSLACRWQRRQTCSCC